VTDVSAVSSTSLFTTSTSSATPKKEMDQEVFLALLVAQMRYQDPTSPMDTTEMMAQSTQLASMEQLTAVADTSRESFALQMRIAANSLLGQEVAFTDADGVARTGIATSVDFSGEVPFVVVGDLAVRLDAISAVRSTRPTDGSALAGPTDGTTDSTTTA
jgi:flagellar basal-body rod modification protein FlgD